MIYDILAGSGLVILSVGVWAEFGWPYACIVFGLCLLITGIKGAINDPPETIQ